MDFLRNKVIIWTTSTAGSMVALRMFTPNMIDFVFDILTVGLVAIAGNMAKSK